MTTEQIKQYVKKTTLQDLQEKLEYLDHLTHNIYWDTKFEEYEDNVKRLEFVENCLKYIKDEGIGEQKKLL